MTSRSNHRFLADLAEQLAIKYLTRSSRIKVQWNSTNSFSGHSPIITPFDVLAYVKSNQRRMWFAVEVKVTTDLARNIERKANKTHLDGALRRTIERQLTSYAQVPCPVLLFVVSPAEEWIYYGVLRVPGAKSQAAKPVGGRVELTEFKDEAADTIADDVVSWYQNVDDVQFNRLTNYFLRWTK